MHLVLKIFLIQLLFCSLLFSSTPGDTTKTEVPENNKAKKEKAFGFHSLVDRLDSFFSEEQIEEELQTSSLRIKPAIIWRESGRFNYPVPVKINIVLPRLQNRWQIFFSSLPDFDNDQDPDTEDFSDDEPGLEVEQTTNSLVGLQFAPFSELTKHLKFISGVKIRTNEFNPFGMMRFRYRMALGDWNMRFVQSGFWFYDIGFGEKTRVDFGRSLGAQTWFRSRSTILWSEVTRGIDLKQTFFLRHFVTERVVLGAYWRMGAHTKPATVLDGHTFAIELRTKLLDWLFLQISPQAVFHRKADFRMIPVAFSDIEIIL